MVIRKVIISTLNFIEKSSHLISTGKNTSSLSDLSSGKYPNNAHLSTKHEVVDQQFGKKKILIFRKKVCLDFRVPIY